MRKMWAVFDWFVIDEIGLVIVLAFSIDILP